MWFQTGKTALGLASRGSFIGIVDMIIKADHYNGEEELQDLNDSSSTVQCGPYYHHCFYGATCTARGVGGISGVSGNGVGGVGTSTTMSSSISRPCSVRQCMFVFLLPCGLPRRRLFAFHRSYLFIRRATAAHVDVYVNPE